MDAKDRFPLLRKALVDGVFAAAKLPLVRLRARAGYAVSDVEDALRPYFSDSGTNPPPRLSGLAPAVTVGAATAEDACEQVTRSCPKCGGTMVLRTAKSGANSGGTFWGLPQLPSMPGHYRGS